MVVHSNKHDQILRICPLFLVLLPTMFHRMDFSPSPGGEVGNGSYYVGSIKRR